MTEARHDDAREHSSLEGTPLLEWAATAIGVILVASTLAFLIYQAIAVEPTPPFVLVEPTSIEQFEAMYLVRFSAYNEGGKTAAGVTVEGHLLENGDIVESSSTGVTYVPPHSVRNGGLYFEHDPRLYEIVLEAIGYEEP